MADWKALCEELTDEELWELYRGPGTFSPIEFARAAIAADRARCGRPAPAPAGEVGELAALIRQIALAWEPDARLLGNMTAGQFTRAADLLDELVQVAYAASDFICGTHFPEFANEHGGIDRLTADLRRLVAQFEYGPRPVPGVDVPGPDGDWGGLEELCKAEGVDLRIGVPLLQRAQEAWKNASQAAPVPVAPYREVADLVVWLEDHSAECLELDRPEWSKFIAKAAKFLHLYLKAAPVPVAVSERWPEFSDCDPDDRPWCFNPVLKHWKLSRINQSIHTHWLPFHALPLPAGEVG